MQNHGLWDWKVPQLQLSKLQFLSFKIQTMDNVYESIVFKILVSRKERTVIPERQVMNKVKPYNCPRSLSGESFQATVHSRETIKESHHLLELRRQINQHNANQSPI